MAASVHARASWPPVVGLLGGEAKRNHGMYVKLGRDALGRIVELPTSDSNLIILPHRPTPKQTRERRGDRHCGNDALYDTADILFGKPTL